MQQGRATLIQHMAQACPCHGAAVVCNGCGHGAGAGIDGGRDRQAQGDIDPLVEGERHISEDQGKVFRAGLAARDVVAGEAPGGSGDGRPAPIEAGAWKQIDCGIDLCV